MLRCSGLDVLGKRQWSSEPASLQALHRRSFTLRTEIYSQFSAFLPLRSGQTLDLLILLILK